MAGEATSNPLAERPAPTQAPPPSNPLHEFLHEGQDFTLVQRAYSRALELCLPSEEIQYIAVQQKRSATFSPDAVLLTNLRLFIFRPQIIGMSFENFRWLGVTEVQIKEGMLGATFHAQLAGGKRVDINDLPKPQARKLHQLAKEMTEQAHRQSLRPGAERQETAKAESASRSDAIPALATWAEEAMQKLQQLKRLHEQELITAQEYAAKKAEILARF